jgi:hypothetical protein
MGTDALEEFYADMEDVLIIGVNSDKTINLKTSVQDLEEVQAILNTALMMVLLHKVKSDDFGVDRMH